MYTFFQLIAGLFLRRRVRLTLTNGSVLTYRRPRDVSADDYRMVFEQWRAAANKRLKLSDGTVVHTVSSSDVISVEVR